MTAQQKFRLTVNGKVTDVTATPDMPLLWALRQEAGVLGVKFGCGAALCGACTVHLDGAPTRSCQVQLGDVGSAKITTVEGLSADPLGAHLQAAWLELDVMQCGYCQAGQLLSAHALLRQTPQPTAADIDKAMDGNICRCATYNRIRAAIALVASRGAGHVA